MNSVAKSKKSSSPAIAKPKKDNRNTVNPNLSLSRRPKGNIIQECGLPSINPGGCSEREAAALSNFHPDLLADVAYFRLSEKLLPGDKLLAAAFGAGLKLQIQQRPTCALERLTLTQVLLAHGRVCSLTEQLAKQTAPGAIATISQAVERAARTFEQLLRAYRQPRNSGAGYSIGQVNLAHQQVVEVAKARGDFPKKESRRTK
jgi:hypothetical protein